MSLLLSDDQLPSGGKPLLSRLRQSRGWRVLSKGLLWVLSLFCLTILMAGGTYLYIQRDGNFHVVESQEVYRSAQQSGEEFRELIKSHGIKTVINLRGENTGTPWYDDEISAVRAEGIQHENIRISAYRELSVQQMDDIIRIIDQAPKPVLIHCESGADRTGLVSAIYRLSKGRSLQLAEQELSPKYGHFPYLLSKSGAMDRSLANFAQGRSPSP